jgi:UDP-N-acetylglucosamine 2-epimerase (non-hydrolysing)
MKIINVVGSRPTIQKIPCLTLRENTERPVTAEISSNMIIGAHPNRTIKACKKVLDGPWREFRIPPLERHTAERIVKILVERLSTSKN